MQGVVQMAEMNSLRKRLIFALDVPEPAQAEAFVRFLENPEISQDSRGERIGWRWLKESETAGRLHA